MCREIYTWAILNQRRWPCLQWLHKIENEGKRDPKVAHEIGILTGVSDYFWPAPTARFHGLYLEVKKPGETPTRAQSRWLRHMRKLGFRAEYVDTLQSAFMILETHAREATKWMKENNIAILD